MGLIDLWLIRTNEDPAESAAVLEACLAGLSQDEQTRARRFHFPVDSARFALCRSTLRRLLADATGTPPLDLHFAEGPHGKPFLRGLANAPHFNLSHTRGLAVIAISQPHELGVDTEASDRPVNALELARRVFTPREIATLEPLEGPPLTERFFRYWTAKEAFLKATGRGLALDPRKLETSLPETEHGLGSFRCTDAEIDTDRWRLHELHEVPGFRIALAAPLPVDRDGIVVHPSLQRSPPPDL